MAEDEDALIVTRCTRGRCYTCAMMFKSYTRRATSTSMTGRAYGHSSVFVLTVREGEWPPQVPLPFAAVNGSIDAANGSINQLKKIILDIHRG